MLVNTHDHDINYHRKWLGKGTRRKEAGATGHHAGLSSITGDTMRERKGRVRPMPLESPLNLRLILMLWEKNNPILMVSLIWNKNRVQMKLYFRSTTATGTPEPSLKYDDSWNTGGHVSEMLWRSTRAARLSDNIKAIAAKPRVWPRPCHSRRQYFRQWVDSAVCPSTPNCGP